MSKNKWEPETYSESDFPEEFKLLGDVAQEIVKDFIRDILGYANPETHPNAVPCDLKPNEVEEDMILFYWSNPPLEVMIKLDQANHKLSFVHCKEFP